VVSRRGAGSLKYGSDIGLVIGEPALDKPSYKRLIH